MHTQNRITISVVRKAFNVIESMVTRDEWSLAELCAMLEYPKTTLHRMITTLEELGYVKQNPRNLSYSVTLKLFEVGSNVIQRLDFVEIAKPFMINLSNITNETINLGILEGLDVVCLHKVESKHHLRLDQPVGYREKAYCTAYGKAMLAYLPEDERSRLFSENGITGRTAKSLRTLEEIEEDIRMTRARGYSIDNEEGVVGVSCVGAPVFGCDSQLIAGLSIAGPTMRIENNLEYFGKLVGETALSISRNFGWQSPNVTIIA